MERVLLLAAIASVLLALLDHRGLPSSDVAREQPAGVQVAEPAVDDCGCDCDDCDGCGDEDTTGQESPGCDCDCPCAGCGAVPCGASVLVDAAARLRHPLLPALASSAYPPFRSHRQRLLHGGIFQPPRDLSAA